MLFQLAKLKTKEFEHLVEGGVNSIYTLRQLKNTEYKLIEYLKYRSTQIVEPEIRRTRQEIDKYVEDNSHYDISIEEVAREFIHDFRHYLKAIRSSKLDIASSSKQIKNTKNFIKYGVEKGIIPYNPIDKVRNPSGDKEVIPLDYEEIFSLMAKGGLIKRLEEIRIAFIIQIFTGFSFQDLKELPRTLRL